VLRVESNGELNLNWVIGQAVRTIRKRNGIAQDERARTCRKKGLRWGRSSVAMLESGRRSCSISELLIVASALDAPLPLIVGGGCLPDRPTTVLLTATTAADLAAVSEVLVSWDDTLKEETANKIGWVLSNQEADAWTVESGEAEQKAARRLGITTERLMSAAESLWGMSLTAERERQLRDDFGLSSEPGETIAEQRHLRAFRGHLTRELVRQLQTVLDEQEE
jgi:transcriptional regulator with XRE-family HTH domain